MVANADLPVWTIAPNWRGGILERLEWLTGVEASTNGTEQAQAYRLSPRRSFEAAFNPVGDVRSYFDLWLHRFGHLEFMLPLWHDAGRLAAEIAPGATTIPFDTMNREFNVGDLALLIGETPHDFDKVSITAVAYNQITVSAGGVTRTWPTRSKIYPLRRARLAQESQVNALTSRVGEASVLFELNQGNDILSAGAWDSLLYADLPVLTTTPNYREQIDMQFVRNALLLDNEQGLRELADDAGRAFTVQMHSFMFQGRAAHWSFRQMLYRLGGMQGALWLPTYNEDFVLSAARLATDDYLDIRKIGYEYSGGVIEGRKHVLIEGVKAAEIAEVRAAPGATQERLGLAAALGAAFPAGAKGCFMDTARLASDTVEIVHHTDTDGVGECNLGFRSFLDARADADPVYYPLAAGDTRVSECGTEEPPAESNCQIEFVVDLPEPLANTPNDYQSGNVWFQVNVESAGETPYATEQFQIDFNTDLTTTPYTYKGLNHPLAHDVFHDVTWAAHLGYGSTNRAFSVKYDSITNKLIVRVYTPVRSYANGGFVSVGITGIESQAPGSDLMVSVTQGLDGGAPADLPLIDANTKQFFMQGGVQMAYRYMDFESLAQTPCVEGGTPPPDPADYPCLEQAHRLPLVITMPMPASPPTEWKDDLIDDYMWSLRGRFTLKGPDCDTKGFSFYLGSGSNNFGAGTEEAGFTDSWTDSYGVWNGYTNSYADVTITAVRNGTELTITLDCTDPDVTLVQNWLDPTGGNYYDARWWALTISGWGGGWLPGSFSTVAEINLVNPVETGAPPGSSDNWNGPHNVPGLGDVQYNYSYYFTPYLEDEV